MPRQRGPALLLGALAFLMLSCAEGGFVDRSDRGDWKGDGVEVRWSPAKPKLGDSVRVEASCARDAQPGLSLPDGSAVDPLALDYLPQGKLLRWSFRVKAAGDYKLGAQILWSAASVSGEANELKTHDPGQLWTGRAGRAGKAKGGGAAADSAPRSTLVPMPAPPNGAQGAAKGGSGI